jgi:hypothetical protein
MGEHRFNVFGQVVMITGCPGGWSAYFLGPDGKRRNAEFVVPGSLTEDELCQYLSDLFHEMAGPTHPAVTRIR